jgi:hypothetical protein
MINKKKHIFISYTTRDGYLTKENLGKIKAFYEKSGSTFVDIIDNNSELKQERVYNELHKADIFVLLKTPEINNSKWVNKEIKIAKRRLLNINYLELDEIKKITAANTV